MRRLALSAVMAAFSTAALAGPISDADIAQFKIGAATVQDVEAKLGKPQTVERDQTGVSAIRYAQIHTHVKAASFVPVVGLFAGGATGNVSTVTFKFSNEVLTGVETSDTNVTCHTMGSCQ